MGKVQSYPRTFPVTYRHISGVIYVLPLIYFSSLPFTFGCVLNNYNILTLKYLCIHKTTLRYKLLISKGRLNPNLGNYISAERVIGISIEF